MDNYLTPNMNLDDDFQHLQTNQKQEAAKNCNCTIADVENTLARFTWAKEAEKKMMQMKEEGKPLPKSLAEVNDFFVPQHLLLITGALSALTWICN